MGLYRSVVLLYLSPCPVPRYERELKKLRAELQARSRSLVDKRALLEVGVLLRRRIMSPHSHLSAHGMAISGGTASEMRRYVARQGEMDFSCDRFLPLYLQLLSPHL